MYHCEYCGKEVYENYGSGRFCSRSCANGWVSSHQSDESKRKKVEAGRKNLTRHPENLVQNNLDNRDYMDKFKLSASLSKTPEVRKKLSDALVGRTLSDETRNKISDKVRLSHAEGRNSGWKTRKGVESSAEKFWRGVLDDNGILYQQECKVNKPGPGCYFLDFLLDGNVDLEIDGHQHYYEESRILSDKVRDEYLGSIGFIVYRIKFVNPENSLRVQEDIDRFLAWYGDLKAKLNEL